MLSRGENSGKDYVSGSLCPAVRLRKHHANLDRTAGRDDDNVFAVICNPATERSIDRTAQLGDDRSSNSLR